MAKRVLIVGAGPGGLAAGMLLARSGLSVKIIEPPGHRRRANLHLAPQRLSLRPGADVLLYPRVLEEIFSAVGRDLHQEVPMVRLDPQYHLVFFGSGGELRCTPDVDETSGTVVVAAVARWQQPSPPPPPPANQAARLQGMNRGSGNFSTTIESN